MIFTENFPIERIVVIESLRPEDLKTGRELYDSLLRGFEPNYGIQVDFFEVRTQEDLNATLVALEAETTDIPPLLHFEMHGGEQHFQLSSGELISWDFLWHFYARIFAKTGKQLFVCLSACVSNNSLKSLSIRETAPLWSIVVSNHPMEDTVLLSSYKTFYSLMFGGGSIYAAAESPDLETDGKLNLRFVNMQGLLEQLVQIVEDKYYLDPQKRQELEDPAVQQCMSVDPNAFQNNPDFARMIVKFWLDNRGVMYSHVAQNFLGKR